MSRIVSANSRKVLSTVTLEQWDQEKLTFTTYPEGNGTVEFEFRSAARKERSSLRTFIAEMDDAAVDDSADVINRTDLMAELQRRDDADTYNGEPRPGRITFYIDREHADVLANLLSGSAITSTTKQTIDDAIAVPGTSWDQ